MDFWVYDITLLILFSLFVIVFLSKKKKNLKREGILFLYRTKIGLKFIDYFGKKYKKTLKFLSYISVSLGYFLMSVVSVYLVWGIYKYITIAPKIPEISRAVPIALLIPYFPKLFGLEMFFPNPFYFLYFIIIIAVVAIVHEGFHGIFAKYYDVKIKSTGFGFLGPILAFFVEQDDEQMKKKKIFPQLTILSSGVFANIIVAIISFLLMFLLFNCAYTPNGVEYASYATAAIPFSLLKQAVITDDSFINGDNFTKIIIENNSYLVTEKFFEFNLDDEGYKDYGIMLYLDQPAIRNNFPKAGVITKINGNQIKSMEGLTEELGNYNPKEEITIEIQDNGNIEEYTIELGESGDGEKRGVIGINVGSRNIFRFFAIIEPFKDYAIDYKPKFAIEFIDFLYYLLAWMIFVNFVVAFLNMLPVGIFDGGRFFYLTILALTKNKKIAKKSFKFATILIIFLFAMMIAVWIVRWFGVL